MPPRDRGQRRAQPARPGRWRAVALGGHLLPGIGKTVPALDFPGGCPGTIDAQVTAVLDAVAAAPAPRFSGGGKWEAMQGRWAAGTRSA